MKEENLYNYFLIKKAIFSEDINTFFKEITFENNQENYKLFLTSLHEFLEDNKNIFEKNEKLNTLQLTEFLLDNIDYLSKEEKVNELNYFKITLNKIKNDNYLFLKNELANRNYGVSLEKSKIFNFIFSVFEKEQIDELRKELNSSISFDFNVLNLFYVDKKQFMERNYINYILKKNFYKSLNYFLINYDFLFYDEDFVEKINYIDQMNYYYENHYNPKNKNFYQEIDKEYKALKDINKTLYQKKFY